MPRAKQGVYGSGVFARMRTKYRSVILLDAPVGLIGGYFSFM